MYTCASCGVLACRSEGREHMPPNCPMRHESRIDEAFAAYVDPAVSEFYIASSEMEAIGYGKWPRLRETVEFCKRLSYRKVGVAFCVGLRKEAKVICSVLRSHGLEVVSVICKTGGIPKERAGIPKEFKVNPDCFEAMCNPIAQAKLLNSQETQLNIAVGLCVGHDSLFYKHSEAPVTTLIAKDRVLAHNPVGAVYCYDGYMREKL